MERLTGRRLIDGKADAVGFDLEEIQMAYDKLCAYEDAEERGRLIELPVAVGDHMWCLPDKEATLKEITEFEVTSVEHCKDADYVHLETIYMRYPVCFDIVNIGRLAFFSREEAEAKLMESEEQA